MQATDAGQGQGDGEMNGDSVDVDVVDVAGVTPTDIAEFGESSLGHAVRRILIAVDRGEEPVAAFQDSL